MEPKRVLIILLLIVFTQIQFIPMPFNCDNLNLSIFHSEFYFLLRYVIIITICILVKKWISIKKVIVVFLFLLIPEIFYKERRFFCSKIFVSINENKKENFYNPFLGLKGYGDRYNWCMTIILTQVTGGFESINFELNHNHNDAFPYKVLNKDWYIFYDII